MERKLALIFYIKLFKKSSFFWCVIALMVFSAEFCNPLTALTLSQNSPLDSHFAYGQCSFVTAKNFAGPFNQIPDSSSGLCKNWMDKVVEQEFSGFEKNGITKENLDKTWKKCKKISEFKRYKIIRSLVYGPESNIKNLLCVLVKTYPMQDVDFIYYHQDVLRRDFCEKNMISVPILASAKDEKLKQVVLFIDWYYDILSSKENSWNSLVRAIDENQNQREWAVKFEKAFWRGSVTDGNYTPENWKFFPRGRLVDISCQNPDLIDAGFVNYPPWNVGDPLFFIENVGLCQFVLPVNQLQYKYQIDVDGVTCTYPGLQWKLLSGCLVFKQNSQDIMWYHRALVPWEHYIPLETDLSDLVEKILWAKTHDSEARRIAQQGRHFAQTWLTQDQILYYCFKILTRYACLQRFNPSIN